VRFLGYQSAGGESVEEFERGIMISLTLNLIKLTKPKIMLLVLAAGISALIIDGSIIGDPGRFAAFLLGLFLTGGCANAMNQYFERDIDSVMTRTAGKRPLPLGDVAPYQALVFSIVIGVAGVALLILVFNMLTGVLALATILFYGLVYTLWLKPKTSQNIVIGGIAGAMAPVGAWTAAAGSMSLMPWFMFLIIFLWTPPHFWSLALCYKDDYKNTGLPMMPLVKGDKKTLDLILFYTIITVCATLTPLFINFSWIYLSFALVFGTIFIYKSLMAWRKKCRSCYRGLFKYSIVYLFVILSALAFVDVN
jgi:protoheme IX farnesyltransferase